MSNVKFEVGDKVTVIEGLVGGEYYDDLFFNEVMESHTGKTYEISSESWAGHYYLKEIDSDNDSNIGMWQFNDSMLKPAKEKPKMEVDTTPKDIVTKVLVDKVIYNDPAVIIFYKDLNGNQKKSVAQCKAGDEFDKEKGFQVAYLKLLMKESRRQLRSF